jgi:Tfp pilus assembly protein PilN
MLERSESVLGLDIEPQGIKILELKKTAEGIELVKAQMLPVPADSLKDGVIIEPKSIAVVIKEFIQTNNILARKVAVVLNPNLTLIRLLRIPFMSEPEMRSLLETEANQYVDFKHKEKFIDFCLLEELNEEGVKKVNVIFAAALKEVVNAFIRVVEEANLELIGLDVSALAIIRALYGVNINLSSIEPEMLVIINPKDIQICILKSNRPRFLHTVKMDIKELAVAKEEFINRLIFSIKLVTNYYSRAIHGQEDIRNIIVSINDPVAKDIDKELIQRLEGLFVVKANPLGRLKIDNAIFSEEAKEDIALSFTRVIGATLKIEDTMDYPLSLNLVPIERLQRLMVNKELTIYASALTILLATSLILAGVIWVNNRLLQMKISGLEQQLKQTTPILNKLIQDFSNNLDINERINEGEQIITEANKKRTIFSSNSLAEILLLVPEGLWLTDISTQLKEDSLILTGNALDGKYVFEYVKNLISSGYFSKVEPVFSENQTQKQPAHFIIRCQLKTL